MSTSDCRESGAAKATVGKINVCVSGDNRYDVLRNLIFQIMENTRNVAPVTVRELVDAMHQLGDTTMGTSVMNYYLAKLEHDGVIERDRGLGSARAGRIYVNKV